MSNIEATPDGGYYTDSVKIGVASKFNMRFYGPRHSVDAAAVIGMREALWYFLDFSFFGFFLQNIDRNR